MPYNPERYVSELAQCGVDRLREVEYLSGKMFVTYRDDVAWFEELSDSAYNYLRSAAHVARKEGLVR